MAIGCAGSGKSTLARRLGAISGLPVVERDALGEENSPEALAAIASVAASGRWIFDGHPYYAEEIVFGAADTVVFFDFPKSLVLWRVLRRTVAVELPRARSERTRHKGCGGSEIQGIRFGGRGHLIEPVISKAQRSQRASTAPTTSFICAHPVRPRTGCGRSTQCTPDHESRRRRSQPEVLRCRIGKEFSILDVAPYRGC